METNMNSTYNKTRNQAYIQNFLANRTHHLGFRSEKEKGLMFIYMVILTIIAGLI
jgi:hypothetical protein